MGRRGEKTALITTRVPESLRDRIMDQAKSEHRSISQQVSLILDVHVHNLQDHAGKTGMIEPIESYAHAAQ